jgi:tetratricopeptide (TPR) repeat protein
MAALLASAASAATVIVLEPLYAAPAPRGRAAAPAKADPATSVRTVIGNPINESLKLIDMGDLIGALAKVTIADAVPMKTPYEEYTVSKFLGTIYIKQMPQNLAAATVAYNRQIASGAVPDAEKAAMYAMALRLNYAANDFAKVISNVMELQKAGPLDDTAWEVLVQSYYNTMDFMNAVTSAKAAVAAEIAGGMKANPAVLGLLLNSQAKTMDEVGYRATLDQLASVSTQPEVWSQIMDFALSTKNIGDHHLLNLYRLALLVGTIRPDVDYAAMATIDVANGLPAEAKAVLTKGNKPGELMTQANSMLAKDQETLTALAAEAAKQMNGEIDVKLGESYWTYGKFNEAVDAIQKGIAKGGLKDMADAQTTLGIALFSAGKKAEALAAFEKAAMTNTPAGPIAHTWVLYLQRPAA